MARTARAKARTARTARAKARTARTARTRQKRIRKKNRRSNGSRLAGLGFLDSMFSGNNESPTGKYINPITSKLLQCTECDHTSWTVQTVAIGGRIAEAFDVNHFTDHGYVMHTCDRCSAVKTFKNFLMTKEKFDGNP